MSFTIHNKRTCFAVKLFSIINPFFNAIILYSSFLWCYNITATTPRQVEKGGVSMASILSFFISVVASVVAYYICKWLDGDE